MLPLVCKSTAIYYNYCNLYGYSMQIIEANHYTILYCGHSIYSNNSKGDNDSKMKNESALLILALMII
jgi:hypothetical protein